MILDFIFIFFLSFAPALFWFWYLILYKKETKALSFKLLAKIFLGGLILAVMAMFIEVGLAKFIPLNYLLFPKELPFTIDLRSLSFIFILTFVLIAPLEEILKYFFLKREIQKRKEIKFAINGVQLGMVLGLGFATFENGFYFFQETQSLEWLFFFRFFLSTLAHVFYGGIMGYYLSLSKFHKLYKNFFLRRGLITVILLHGFFDFSLLTQAFYYTIGTVIIVFLILMKWMIDRRDFETFIIKKKSPVSAPLFAKKQEIDAFLSKQEFSFSEIKSLSFCPRCLAIKKIGERRCPHCGLKFD